MFDSPKNSIEFKVWGKYAMFTDPLTKLGGEKCSYHIPTYEALIGITKSIYWKPTFIWIIDKVRVINRIRTQTKGTKPIKYSGGNDLSIYTFLADVEYQVQARFVWNEYRENLIEDRIDGKHHNIVKRMLERGGRQDIFLGTRDCQGYVEPCQFGSGKSDYDDLDELAFGMMFHGFDYPDETGKEKLEARFWRPVMKNGVVYFAPPKSEKPIIERKSIRVMSVKQFGINENLRSINEEFVKLGGVL